MVDLIVPAGFEDVCEPDNIAFDVSIWIFKGISPFVKVVVT